MNKNLKAVLLLIILMVPALIFVFLKIFGVNEYDLPVYYKDGIDTVFNDCEFQKGQHLIPDFSLPDYTGQEISRDYLTGAALVVYFTQDLSDPVSHRVNMALARVQGSLPASNQIRILTIQPQKDTSTALQLKAVAGKYGARKNTWYFGYANPVYTNQLARCGFVIDFDAMSDNINNTIVLADHQGSIRGYFNGLDDSEIERLIVELKILNRNRK